MSCIVKTTLFEVPRHRFDQVNKDTKTFDAIPFVKKSQFSLMGVNVGERSAAFFRPLFSRLGNKHSFIWGPYADYHGMALDVALNIP